MRRFSRSSTNEFPIAVSFDHFHPWSSGLPEVFRQDWYSFTTDKALGLGLGAADVEYYKSDTVIKSYNRSFHNVAFLIMWSSFYVLFWSEGTYLLMIGRPTKFSRILLCHVFPVVLLIASRHLEILVAACWLHLFRRWTDGVQNNLHLQIDIAIPGHT